MDEMRAVLEQAFADAGIAVPDDLAAFGLDALEELVPDKRLRGKCKSALIRYQKSLGLDAHAAAAAAPEPVAELAPAAIGDAPLVPAGEADDLWLLRDGAWSKLGRANAVTSHADEIAAGAGGGGRVTNMLILDGQFEAPLDLFNTWCWLAHGGCIYRAYYISHVGDVRRGTRTASLKVDQSYDYPAWATLFGQMAGTERPTADDLRRWRFGRGYEASNNMFAGHPGRLV
jgi:hypothetical protein